MECEYGYLYSFGYVDVIVCDLQMLCFQFDGQEGVIQVLSVIFLSYFGYLLLIEDVGVVYGQDNCFCGCVGCYFFIKGWLFQVEMCGCSDI